jgi:hypothetical protein
MNKQRWNDVVCAVLCCLCIALAAYIWTNMPMTDIGYGVDELLRLEQEKAEARSRGVR